MKIIRTLSDQHWEALEISGKIPHNLFRAMRKLLGWPKDTAPISWIEVPTKKGRKTPWPVFFPHHFLQHLSEDQFRRRLVGPSTSAPLNFWKNMRGSAFVAEHPNLPEPLWQKIIPIGIHGDGGSFTKQDSVMVLSWNSLCAGYGPTLDTRLIFTCIWKADCVENTIDQLLTAFSWSLKTALGGGNPVCELENHPAVRGRAITTQWLQNGCVPIARRL